jgi:hypothetical protein
MADGHFGAAAHTASVVSRFSVATRTSRWLQLVGVLVSERQPVPAEAGHSQLMAVDDVE